MPNEDEFLTPKQAAEYLHTTENSLRSLRSVGKGPPFHKPNGWHALYKKSELDAYQASCGPSARKYRMQRAVSEKERAAPGSTPARP